MILLTGASGFLGKEIQRLYNHGCIRLGRSVESDIVCDLSRDIPDLPKIDIIVHAAGKAHSVPKTEEEAADFFKVNVQGTQNLLDGLSLSGRLPKSFLFISTVAVYGLEKGVDVNEESFLAATDPYGMSKIQAEKLIIQWCKTNHVRCAILRLPLIAGPHPPGNLGAMINGIQKGYYANIAGGMAKKSVVMASDVAKIIEKAAATGGIYNLTDGYHPSFFELSEAIASQLGKKTPINIPEFIARIIAVCGTLLGSKAPINISKLKKITSDLTFDDSKARKLLGWTPTAVLEGLKIR